jgi:copper chaperone CopZ
MKGYTMKFLNLAVALSLSMFAGNAVGQEAAAAKDAKPKTTTATFLVTGLHCPPCTKTVESSLSKAKGIRAVKVDWKTKTARVEFDEKALPAQQVAKLIAATPHMMGGNMHYAGWLAFKAPQIKDEASARRAETALRKVKGVSRVAVYPAQHSFSVSFEGQGKLTTTDLIAALKAAGFEAKPL